ncbi:MAG: YihY/virulence factor BrkB family protein [Deinococcota bacterium]|nr:YihY/virulence factor BrkB family protein [Deinococcota bacterium]
MKKALEFLKAIITKWGKDNATRLAASLAFFTVLSLAPLVIVLMAVVGLFFGEGQAQQQLVNQASEVLGPGGAEMIGTIAENAADQGAGLAFAFGLIVALIGASNVFVQLQNSLNEIWDVAADPRAGVMHTVKNRLFAFAIVLAIGLLILASVVLSTVLTGLQATLPGGWVWRVVEIAVSLALFMGIFALIFKVIPEAKIHWRDVWLGAFVTAVLFTIGRIAMGIYLGGGGVTSVYGAAGSLVALLIWVFYSAQILFFGAEFTQVYSKVRGENILPDKDAVNIPAEQRYKRNLIKEQIAAARGEEARDLEEVDLDEAHRHSAESEYAGGMLSAQERARLIRDDPAGAYATPPRTGQKPQRQLQQSQKKVQKASTKPASRKRGAPATGARAQASNRRETPLSLLLGGVLTAASRLLGRGDKRKNRR